MTIVGSTADGQTAAHSGAQLATQQSISSWLSATAEPAIGQSGAGMANAGPEVNVRDSASQSKKNNRRMPAG